MLKCSDTSALAIQHQQECAEASSHAVWALVVVLEDTVRMATLDMVDTDHNHAAALEEGRVAHECYDPGSDFSARLLTGYDYGIPKVSSHISHGQSYQSA